MMVMMKMMMMAVLCFDDRHHFSHATFAHNTIIVYTHPHSNTRVLLAVVAAVLAPELH